MATEQDAVLPKGPVKTLWSALVEKRYAEVKPAELVAWLLNRDDCEDCGGEAEPCMDCIIQRDLAGYVEWIGKQAATLECKLVTEQSECRIYIDQIKKWGAELDRKDDEIERLRKTGQAAEERESLATRLWKESVAKGEGTCPSSWTGHWMDWYRLRADETIAARNAADRTVTREQAAKVVTGFMYLCGSPPSEDDIDYMLDCLKAAGIAC